MHIHLLVESYILACLTYLLLVFAVQQQVSLG